MSGPPAIHPVHQCQINVPEMPLYHITCLLRTIVHKITFKLPGLTFKALNGLALTNLLNYWSIFPKASPVPIRFSSSFPLEYTIQSISILVTQFPLPAICCPIISIYPITTHSWANIKTTSFMIRSFPSDHQWIYCSTMYRVTADTTWEYSFCSKHGSPVRWWATQEWGLPTEQRHRSRKA